jgi:hypothetical protein
MAALARKPALRFVGQPPERPNRWFPQDIVDQDGIGMTDMAAWEFIADCLEDASQTLESLILDHPPGAHAHVMKVAVPWSQGRIYIKFEFGNFHAGRRFCGRSFHLEQPR